MSMSDAETISKTTAAEIVTVTNASPVATTTRVIHESVVGAMTSMVDRNSAVLLQVVVEISPRIGMTVVRTGPAQPVTRAGRNQVKRSQNILK